MRAIAFLFEKSLADIKREYKKKAQKYLATTPPSERRAEKHEDKVEQHSIGHKMKDFSIDLRQQGHKTIPGFEEPGDEDSDQTKSSKSLIKKN